MSSQTGKKERIHYFDIMKGILILMVIIGHTNSIETLTSTELKQFPFHLTQYVSCNLFTPHFMAGFFLVTGYCSNFQKRISEQIVTDFRRLIVPAFIINALMNCISGINTITFRSIVVLPWFIIALFVAKLMVKVTIENMTSNEKYERKNKINKTTKKNNEYQFIENELCEKLGTKVKIKKNKIEISFVNSNDLNRLLEIMNLESDN